MRKTILYTLFSNKQDVLPKKADFPQGKPHPRRYSCRAVAGRSGGGSVLATAQSDHHTNHARDQKADQTEEDNEWKKHEDRLRLLRRRSGLCDRVRDGCDLGSDRRIVYQIICGFRAAVVSAASYAAV